MNSFSPLNIESPIPQRTLHQLYLQPRPDWEGVSRKSFSGASRTPATRWRPRQNNHLQLRGLQLLCRHSALTWRSEAVEGDLEILISDQFKFDTDVSFHDRRRLDQLLPGRLIRECCQACPGHQRWSWSCSSFWGATATPCSPTGSSTCWWSPSPSSARTTSTRTCVTSIQLPRACYGLICPRRRRLE